MKARARELIEAFEVDKPSVFSTVNQVWHNILYGKSCAVHWTIVCAKPVDTLSAVVATRLWASEGGIAPAVTLRALFLCSKIRRTTSSWILPAASASSWKRRCAAVAVCLHGMSHREP